MQLFVNIDVDDLKKGIDFYVQGLGLVLTRRLFGGTVAEMQGASSLIYLIEQPAGSTAVPCASIPRQYDCHWTPVHLDFLVEQLDSAMQRALNAGAKLERPPQACPWGSLATFSDPFGHGFCLLQLVGKGYAQVE